MSTQLSLCLASAKKKKGSSCNVLITIALRPEVSVSIWKLHNIVSHEDWSSHRHRCSLGRVMHDAAKRPNAHYEIQTKRMPLQQ